MQSLIKMQQLAQAWVQQLRSPSWPWELFSWLYHCSALLQRLSSTWTNHHCPSRNHLSGTYRAVQGCLPRRAAQAGAALSSCTRQPSPPASAAGLLPPPMPRHGPHCCSPFRHRIRLMVKHGGAREAPLCSSDQQQQCSQNGSVPRAAAAPRTAAAAYPWHRGCRSTPAEALSLTASAAPAANRVRQHSRPQGHLFLSIHQVQPRTWRLYQWPIYFRGRLQDQPSSTAAWKTA